MQLNVQTLAGKIAQTLELNDTVFACEYNEPLIHQTVTAAAARLRAGTHKQKTRSEVSGGGAKPWRQKGTGQARQGSTRSPIWCGGGRAFPAIPRDYTQKLNKKMYRAAMRSIFSTLLRDGRLIAVENFELTSCKTKEASQRLKDLNIASHVLILVDELTENTYLACRNLANVLICEANGVSPIDLLRYRTILVTVPALKQIEELLA